MDRREVIVSASRILFIQSILFILSMSLSVDGVAEQRRFIEADAETGPGRRE